MAAERPVSGDRTKGFALEVLGLAGSLPRGQSVGANYRAACRAQSRADFSAKPNGTIVPDRYPLYTRHSQQWSV